MNPRYATRDDAEQATAGTQDFYPVFKTSAPRVDMNVPVTCWWEVEYRSEADVQRSVDRWLNRQVFKTQDRVTKGPYAGALESDVVGV